jgi:hypothetical protein
MTPYESTVLCQVCGERLPIFRSVTRLGRLLIPPHTCPRYLVATRYRDAVAVDVRTSQVPGATGPHNLVRVHGAEAEAWRPMDSLSGWAYAWKNESQPATAR